MTAAEVSDLHSAMRRYGVPGVLAPVDPADPAGPWRVYDAAGRDITAETLAEVAAVRRRPSTRGFVLVGR